jgi:hypothetical protein
MAESNTGLKVLGVTVLVAATGTALFFLLKPNQATAANPTGSNQLQKLLNEIKKQQAQKKSSPNKPTGMGGGSSAGSGGGSGSGGSKPQQPKTTPQGQSGDGLDDGAFSYDDSTSGIYDLEYEDISGYDFDISYEDLAGYDFGDGFGGTTYDANFY